MAMLMPMPLPKTIQKHQDNTDIAIENGREKRTLTHFVLSIGENAGNGENEKEREREKKATCTDDPT